jgi:hypothetical protein
MILYILYCFRLHDMLHNTLLGMQAGGIAPKALSITAHINLRRNQRDAGLKTSANSTSDTTKHNELCIY